MTGDPGGNGGRGSGGRVYLDNAATTPLREEALEAMLPFLKGSFENASGVHSGSRAVRRSLDEAREELAGCLGCSAGEVVLTSGGTEADNLAVRGVVGRLGGTVVVSSAEHRAVLRPAEAVGGRVVPVGRDGVVDLDSLGASLDESVSLVSVMLVNSEVGAISPIEEIAGMVRELAPRALVHCDAVQGLVWLDVASVTSCCDLVSISGHKFGGPKGMGALVVRGEARRKLAPLVTGGEQERGLRAGTENVAGAVGMATAARRAVEEREAVGRRVGALRDVLADGLVGLGAVEQAGPRQGRIEGSCHVRFPGIEADELLVLLDGAGIAASAGSACASGAHEPSHVLVAMGWSASEAREAVRFSLGAETRRWEIDSVLEAVPSLIGRLSEGPAGS